MNIGERIISLRTNKNWSQKQLASYTGMNVSVLNRIERGERPVRDSEIVKISELLEVSTDYLLRGEDYRKEVKENFKNPYTHIAARDGNNDAERALELIEEILRKRREGK